MASRSFGRAAAAALAVLVGVSACTVPDLQPFAQNTAKLNAQLTADTKATVTQVEGLAKAARAVCNRQAFGDLEGQSAAMRAFMGDATAAGGAAALCPSADGFAGFDELIKAQRKLSAITGAAAAYSESLAALAAESRLGEANGARLGGAVAALAEVVSPGLGGVFGGTVQTVFAKAGELLTNAQIRGSLREATGEAQPGIDLIAFGVREYFTACDVALPAEIQASAAAAGLSSGCPEIAGSPQGYVALIEGLYTGVKAALLQQHDLQAVMFYEQHGARVFEAARGVGGDAGSLRTSRAFTELSASLDLLEAARPSYEAYRRDLAALDAWRAERLANAPILAQAFVAWAQEHRGIAAGLEGPGLSLSDLLDQI